MTCVIFYQAPHQHGDSPTVDLSYESISPTSQSPDSLNMSSDSEDEFHPIWRLLSRARPVALRVPPVVIDLTGDSDNVSSLHMLLSIVGS